LTFRPLRPAACPTERRRPSTDSAAGGVDIVDSAHSPSWCGPRGGRGMNAPSRRYGMSVMIVASQRGHQEQRLEAATGGMIVRPSCAACSPLEIRASCADGRAVGGATTGGPLRVRRDGAVVNYLLLPADEDLLRLYLMDGLGLVPLGAATRSAQVLAATRAVTGATVSLGSEPRVRRPNVHSAGVGSTPGLAPKMTVRAAAVRPNWPAGGTGYRAWLLVGGEGEALGGQPS
jgi:hypothetical protein